MTKRPRKMSEIIKEMSDSLLRDPKAIPSSEAAHVALFLANIAWNECIGLGTEREGCCNVWQTIEADKPDLWDELKSRDIDAMIDELVEYKETHFPDDRRRIVTCGGTPHGTIRVEWLPPAAPGVDARWEAQLYGMVRTGQRKAAIRFLRESRGMSRAEATKKVKQVAADLGSA